MKMIQEKNVVIALLIVSLLLQLGYMIVYESPINLEYGSDSEQYIHLAKNVLSGKGYVIDRRGDVLAQNTYYDKSMEKPTAFRLPSYPLFLAGIFLLSQSYKLVYLFQIGLVLIMFFMFYRIARKFLNHTTALICLGLLIIWPVYICFSTQIMSEILGCFLLTSIIYILSFKEGYRWMLLIGFLSAAAVLTRAEFFLLFPILLIFSFFKKGLKTASILFIIFVLCLSPWIARNYIVFDKFIPISTQSGEGIYFGTLPYNPDIQDQGGIVIPYYFSLVNSSISETEISDALTKAAIENIKTNSIGVAKNKLHNFFIHWIMPYRINVFDSGQYNEYVSKIKFFDRFIKSGSIGHKLFKYGYWGFWIFIWLSGFLSIIINIKNKRLWGLFILSLFPLIVGIFVGFGERSLIPFFPFILMLACYLWLKNENWNFRGRIEWTYDSKQP